MKKSFITVALALFVSFFITFTFACSTTVEEPAPEEAKTEQQEEKKTEPPASNGGSSGGTSQGGGSNPAGGQNGGGQTPLTPESGTPPQTPQTPPQTPETPETPQPSAPVINYTVTFMSNCETATGTTNSITAAENTNITLPANGFIREGYTFTGWNTAADGTGTGYAESSTIKLTGNLILYAQWILATVPTYEVRIINATNNWLTLSQNNAAAGTEITLTFKPSYLGYVWGVSVTELIYMPVANSYGWIGLSLNVHQDSENPNIYTFIMPSHDVNVSYQCGANSPLYTHEIIRSCENGQFNSLELTYSWGNEVSFTVTPDYGCVFDSISIVKEDGREVPVTVSQSNVYSFIMPNQNVTITANCEFIEHRITIAPVENGTVSVSNTEASVGTEITVTLSPDNNYCLNSIIVTPEIGNTITPTINSTNPYSYTFTMPNSSVTVNVTYEPATYYVVTFVTDCSVQIPQQTVAKNLTATFVTISNNSECEGFLGWYTDSACTNQFNFTRTPITDDISLYAKWEKFKVTSENVATRIASLHYSCWIVASGVFDNLGIREINTVLKQIYSTNETIKVSLDFLDVTLVELEDADSRNRNNSFYECKNLKEIKLPQSLLRIGEYAFENCESLERVAIPSGVTIIGASAFESCTRLESVIIPSGVTKIEPDTFYLCSNLKNITIPSGVTEIGSRAFYLCRSLQEVIIPSGVTKIESFAFYCCYSLKNVTIPNGITKLFPSTFAGCGITRITIPSGVTEIGYDAFRSCELENLIIPSGVTKIGSNAFCNCYKLIGNLSFQDINSSWELKREGEQTIVINPISASEETSTNNYGYLLTNTYKDYIWEKQ